jgi:hypothetical protein
MERRFTLSDGMILTAGLGVGLALLKAADLDRELVRSWDRLLHSTTAWSPGVVIETIVEHALVLGLPFAAGMTPCCLYLQTRGRPGYAACLIATVLIVPSLAVAAIMVTLTGTPPNRYLFKLLLPTLVAGAGILASWITMRRFGVWKAEATWPDRMGRALGIMWIVMGAMCGYFVMSALH